MDFLLLLQKIISISQQFFSVIKPVFRFLWPSQNKEINPHDKTPFIVIPINELPAKLSSPLKFTPERIERQSKKEIKPGLHIFMGLPGVGKTREAMEYVQELSHISGANVVYLAKKHIDSTVPLPKQEDVRRVVVMIDDYDWGFAPAASNSFIDREAAYKESLINLHDLHKTLKQQLDLHALVVTINQSRLPIDTSDINSIIPECELLELPPVTHSEFYDFILSVSNTLEIKIKVEIINSLAELCDGRFDSIAIFLSSFDKGSEISESDIKVFSDNLQTMWLFFQNNMSEEQQRAYECIKILKDFKLLPRITYVQFLLQSENIYLKYKEVKRVIASLWTIENSQALIYDGQFGPPEYTAALSEKVIFAVLKSSKLHRNDRHSFQEETKALSSFLPQFIPTKIHLRFLRKLNKWFPRDRYFAYLLALAYADRKKYFQGILVLHRTFNAYDPREIIFGKWVAIKSHLLLANLYQCIVKKNDRRFWERYKRIEREYKVAISLADMDFPDLTSDAYGEPIQIKGTPDPNIDINQIFENEHKELGFDIPPSISVNCNHLRAMAHHAYAEYLLSEFHREYDALYHEKTVTELLPDFGEGFLNCARSYLQIGDTHSSLYFANQAESISPKHMDPLTYEYWVSQIKLASFWDMGDMPNAKHWFEKCYELVQKKPLCEDLKLRNSFEKYRNNPIAWKNAEQLGSMRQKDFSQTLTYSIPSLNIKLEFPSNWKIDEEIYSDETLLAVFAPQVTWNEKTHIPNDASITLLYTTQQEQIALDVKSLGSNFLNSLSSIGKANWNWIQESTTSNGTTYCSCVFKIEGSWSKDGIVAVFGLPTCKILLKVMCQTSGKDIFWTFLTSVLEEFTQKLLDN